VSDEENRNLGHEYEANLRRAHISAYVLIAGLVLEIVTSIIWYRGAETIAGIVAVFLIVGGVWGEVFFNDRARKAGDQQLAQYEARTAEANQKAQEAALELAKFRAPRLLSREQMDRISDKVSQFAPLMFDANVTPGNPEFRDCLRHIELALKNAGWAQIDWIGSGEIGNRQSIGLPSFGMTASVRNILIGFLFEETSKYVSPAETLADALMAEGITAHACAMLPGSTTAPIHVIVGPKT
jgi:hypothetical protein